MSRSGVAAIETSATSRASGGNKPMVSFENNPDSLFLNARRSANPNTACTNLGRNLDAVPHQAQPSWFSSIMKEPETRIQTPSEHNPRHPCRHLAQSQH